VFARSSPLTDLPAYLKLDAGQRERWHGLEEDFLRGLDAGWGEIAAHRERLIREVFSEQPDRAPTCSCAKRRQRRSSGACTRDSRQA
jgi:hypothetical protein